MNKNLVAEQPWSIFSRVLRQTSGSERWAARRVHGESGPGSAHKRKIYSREQNLLQKPQAAPALCFFCLITTT